MFIKYLLRRASQITALNSLSKHRNAGDLLNTPTHSEQVRFVLKYNIVDFGCIRTTFPVTL